MDIETIHRNQQTLITKKTIQSDTTKTPDKCKAAFNNFNLFLEQITIVDNNNVNDILLRYLQYLKKSKLTKNTSNQYMILTIAFLKNECKLNVENIKLPKTEKIKPKYINFEQYQEIQNYIVDKQQKIKTKHKIQNLEIDKQIIQLIFNTGLRIHEVLNITIEKFKNAKKDKNNIYQLEIIGTGSKERTIFIPQNVYDSLIQYISKYSTSKHTYIFESNRKLGTPLATRTIERHFREIAKELDTIHGTNPKDKNSYQQLFKTHHLRHTFAIMKLEKGMSINTMQKLLGHSSITTTQIYMKINNDTNLDNDSLSDAVAKLLMTVIKIFSFYVCAIFIIYAILSIYYF